MIIYDYNVSSLYFADDSLKFALNLDDLQKLIDQETIDINNIGLNNNHKKSNIIKYSRKKKIREQINNDNKQYCPINTTHKK